MELAAQKRLAARVMKCGESRVWMDPARLGDISQSITTQDIRKLVKDGIIRKRQKKGVSKSRVRHTAEQKSKGRRKGKGSRKGAIGTRYNSKNAWMNSIRAQRSLAKQLLKNGKIDKAAYKDVYRKSGGGFFRSRAHMLQYVEVSPDKLKGKKKRAATGEGKM